MTVHDPHIRLDVPVGTKGLDDEPIDPRTRRVLAVLRVELGTGLVQEAPCVHDLETCPVRDRFELRAAQRDPVPIRTIHADHDTLGTRHAARLPSMRPPLGGRTFRARA